MQDKLRVGKFEHGLTSMFLRSLLIISESGRYVFLHSININHTIGTRGGGGGGGGERERERGREREREGERERERERERQRQRQTDRESVPLKENQTLIHFQFGL